jgi:hypothetical protein
MIQDLVSVAYVQCRNAVLLQGDISRVRRLLDEGRVDVNETTTEEGESLLSLACSAGYYELAQVGLNHPPPPAWISADSFEWRGGGVKERNKQEKKSK